MQVQAATRSDIPAIMRVERMEGYARLIGRWDAGQHATEIENPSCRYLVARDGTEVAGFAILQGVGSPNHCVRLRRIAVEHAGCGVGSKLLRSVMQFCFEYLAAHRLELFVFIGNDRAYRTLPQNRICRGRRRSRSAPGPRWDFSIDAPDVHAPTGLDGAALTPPRGGTPRRSAVIPGCRCLVVIA
ncbi:MAG: GNAT family N-acetyltransferase [Bradyrhizobium sp.]|nr:GNAT family N-acetyltransferase [Bradyrhizobium sp.]